MCPHCDRSTRGAAAEVKEEKKEKHPENTGDVSLRRGRDGGKAAALKKIQAVFAAVYGKILIYSYFACTCSSARNMKGKNCARNEDLREKRVTAIHGTANEASPYLNCCCYYQKEKITVVSIVSGYGRVVCFLFVKFGDVS